MFMVLSWSVCVSQDSQTDCFHFQGTVDTVWYWTQPRLMWAGCCTLSPSCDFFSRQLRKGQVGAGWCITPPFLSHPLNCRDAEVTRQWWDIAERPASPRGCAGVGCSSWWGAVTHYLLVFLSQTALKKQRPAGVYLFTFSLQTHLLFFILLLRLGFRNMPLFHLETTFISHYLKGKGEILLIAWLSSASHSSLGVLSCNDKQMRMTGMRMTVTSSVSRVWARSWMCVSILSRTSVPLN